jgi:hypothetical protein
MTSVLRSLWLSPVVLTTMTLSDFHLSSEFTLMSLKMEIPCSVIKPVIKSCRLYNGGHIARKSGACYADRYILCTMCFCPTTYVISLLLQRFICIHLLITYLTLKSLFSIRSPQQSYDLCSVEWFGNPACTALPILR